MTAIVPEQMRALADGDWRGTGAGVALRGAADEVDRLRAAVGNAPHDDICWLREDPDNGVLPVHRKCTCWKADVL